jgi:hypothetical protein
VRAGFNQDDVVGLYEATGPLAVRMVDLGVNAGVAGGIFTEAFADGKAGADLLASEGLGGLAARAGVAAHHVQQEFGVAFSSLQATAVPDPRLPGAGVRLDLGVVKAGAGQAFAGIGATIGEAFGGGGGGAGSCRPCPPCSAARCRPPSRSMQGLIEQNRPGDHPVLVIIGDFAASGRSRCHRSVPVQPARPGDLGPAAPDRAARDLVLAGRPPRGAAGAARPVLPTIRRSTGSWQIAAGR